MADEKRLHLGSIHGCSHNQDRQLAPGYTFALHDHMERVLPRFLACALGYLG